MFSEKSLDQKGEMAKNNNNNEQKLQLNKAGSQAGAALTSCNHSRAQQEGLKLLFSLEAQLVKNPPTMPGTPAQFLVQEDLLVMRQATHPSIHGLPWRLSW